MVKVNREVVRKEYVGFSFKVNLPPIDERANLLIDNADKARELRADLEARAKKAGVIFGRSELKNLVILALAPPSDFEPMLNDVGEPVPA